MPFNHIHILLALISRYVCITARDVFSFNLLTAGLVAPHQSSSKLLNQSASFICNLGLPVACLHFIWLEEVNYCIHSDYKQHHNTLRPGNKALKQSLSSNKLSIYCSLTIRNRNKNGLIYFIKCHFHNTTKHKQQEDNNCNMK